VRRAFWRGDWHFQRADAECLASACALRLPRTQSVNCSGSPVDCGSLHATRVRPRLPKQRQLSRGPGVRYDKWKFLFTAKDTWLGPDLHLGIPAIYNLKQDPAE